MFASDRNVPIITYHHLLREGGKKGESMKDAVSVADFERQMRLLKEKSFHVVPLGRLVSMIEAGGAIAPRSVAITFDDGYRSTYTRALPILQKHGFGACVFLATDFIGRESPFPWLPGGFAREALPMSWGEAAAMSRYGMEIGSHTASHRFPLPWGADRSSASLRDRGRP